MTDAKTDAKTGVEVDPDDRPPVPWSVVRGHLEQLEAANARIRNQRIELARLQALVERVARGTDRKRSAPRERSGSATVRGRSVPPGDGEGRG
jgi:hypothetical protein